MDELNNSKHFKKAPLIEHIDYYLNEEGLMVFTENYHLKRGSCCQSGCQHCPYGYTQKINPEIPGEWQNPWADKNKEEEKVAEEEKKWANYDYGD